MAYLNHNIPCVNCFIRDEYLYDHTKGHGQYSVCDVHSVASIEHRVPMFECLLENGVNWTRRPITAFCWKKEAPVYPIEMHHYWDCFSPYIDVNVRERLARKRAELVDHNGKNIGVNICLLLIGGLRVKLEIWMSIFLKIQNINVDIFL